MRMITDEIALSGTLFSLLWLGSLVRFLKLGNLGGSWNGLGGIHNDSDDMDESPEQDNNQGGSQGGSQGGRNNR
jgi:hypothetical protein